MPKDLARYLGAVEWFDDEKGQGIIRSGSGVEVLVYWRFIDEPFKTLAAWQIVSFSVGGNTGSRPQAFDVRIEDRGFARLEMPPVVCC